MVYYELQTGRIRSDKDTRLSMPFTKRARRPWKWWRAESNLRPSPSTTTTLSSGKTRSWLTLNQSNHCTSWWKSIVLSPLKALFQKTWAQSGSKKCSDKIQSSMVIKHEKNKCPKDYHQTSNRHFMNLNANLLLKLGACIYQHTFFRLMHYIA